MKNEKDFLQIGQKNNNEVFDDCKNNNEVFHDVKSSL